MRAAAMAMALAGVATAAKFDSYGNELKTCVPNLDGVVLKSENIESSLTTAGINVMATSTSVGASGGHGHTHHPPPTTTNLPAPRPPVRL